MNTSEFDYFLPQELIAQIPVEPRDASRLMVLDRGSGVLEHREFTHLPDYIKPGDVLVFNQSKVIPARLYGIRQDTGGKVELLLIKHEGNGIWQVLANPGRRLKSGTVVTIIKGDLETPSLGNSNTFKGNSLDENPPIITILEDSDDGTKKVDIPDITDWETLGQIPLPPYIHHELKDSTRYQTVFATAPGSVAAPTAGLHFTRSMIDNLRELGAIPTFITLHVGLDTFRPVHEEDPTQHHIHTEYYEVEGATIDVLNRAQSEGRRVIAVGTTSVRVLEQIAFNMISEGEDQLKPTFGQADIYLLPGHPFRMVDSMITNFHLPRSTLLMLVSAFASREGILRAYEQAINLKYRFYSFGDAMLII